MSAYTKIPPVHVLRSILRRLKVDPTELTAAQREARRGSQSATAAHVLDRYRAHATTQDGGSSSSNAELSKLAYEYMVLQRDIAERRRLQKLDTGAENQLSPKEMSRRAAARAGLELPSLNPDLN
ncbi:unnamed protein product [Pseudo-nitzschia multistriata]|uniref:Uncharacterized protein n=1 Tax=Pseudo-nitzschia multistriata TaxID=183589 RepID=A0A448ZFT3_9STRA|nr:unnamed protein product [Pseudo-nitzschia multistriata]